MSKSIAVLGLGAMGSRMASRLLDAGHRVTVFNRAAERMKPLVAHGARSADSPREAVRGAEVVIGMVRDDEASEAIWLDPGHGALAGLSAGAIAIESSTLTPAWVRRLGEVMKKQGVVFIDAPVVGSRPQAEAGQLLYLVGGEAAVIDRVRDVLLVAGGAVHHVGPVGAGAVMKLAVNALFATQVSALGEVLAMTRRSGIADVDAVDLLASMPVTSPALKGVGALIVARNFNPMFPIALVEKDLRYFEETARQSGSRAPIAEAVREVYRKAIETGFGGDNIAGVAQLFD